MPLTLQLNGWSKRYVNDIDTKLYEVASMPAPTFADRLQVLQPGRSTHEILVIVDGENVPPLQRANYNPAPDSHVSLTAWYAHLSLRGPTSKTSRKFFDENTD
ncbi:MAG: hypothetical protein AAF434_18825 [Pseudomonadota bacterium]